MCYKFHLKILISIVCTAFIYLGTSSYVAAEQSYSIAAVVNDDVITNYSLQQRTLLAIKSSNLENTSKVRQKLKSQILQIMIEEKLKLQEAGRLQISVTNKDMKRAFSELEKQNNLAKGGLDKFLKKNNIPKEVIAEQIRAEIAWQKIIGRRISPRVKLSESEVDETYTATKTTTEKIRNSPKGKSNNILQMREAKKIHLKQVFIRADSDEKKEKAVKKLRTVISKIKTCEEIKAKESKNITYIDLGKIDIKNLNSSIKQVISGLEKNQPSQIIDLTSGVAVFYVCSGKISVEPQQLTESKNITEMTKMPDKKSFAKILGMQKIELEARRYLKRLRDEAFIEIRIQ